MQTLNEIKKAALALPEHDRVLLVDSLMETLPTDKALTLDERWWSEIERRSKEFDEGKIQPMPWEEVKARARQRLSRNG